jgi:hypothetical protein
MTDLELDQLIEAVAEISKNHSAWEKDYIYNKQTNEFRHINECEDKTVLIKPWFVFEKEN